MMKVLLAHNYYGAGAPSGENQVFELESALLARKGHQVRTLVRHNDELRSRGIRGLLLGAVSTPWNVRTAAGVRRALAEFQPDVVHVHNTFPLISPAIFSAVGTRAARVLTLHNYRLFCPAAIPLRGGRACTECMDRRSVLPALRSGCYRDSRLATLPLAASVALHRRLGTWEHHVDAFIALTEFQRDVMVEAGLPRDRVFVKPNFYPGQPEPVPWSRRGYRVVYAGRLSLEKGVECLVRAWLAWGASAPPLRIVGDGPLLPRLSALAKTWSNSRITFMGQLSQAEAEAEIATARLLVLPSLWFEGFPMVLREAFAFGTPAAVSGIGALPRIVEKGRTGFVFQPGDPASLLTVVRTAWADQDGLHRASEHARSEFLARYQEDANYRDLSEIYRRAMSRRDKLHPSGSGRSRCAT